MIANKNASALASTLLNSLKAGTAEKISHNFAYAQISMRADPVTVLRREPKQNFATFLGNAGGLLGMWLGVSALSAFAIMESAVHGDWFGRRKKGKVPRLSDTQESEKEDGKITEGAI